MGRAEVGQTGESSSGSRFTRSHLQAGPVWTVQDMLILVNEIVAVEGDCQDALSSYQKWTIIAENCTALEVLRNPSQCRRKWESLLADYNAVKQWELNFQGNSYWSLECEKREEIGLPVDFDKDLYRAIDDFTKGTERANTESECDSEDEIAEGDVLDAGASGSRPKRVVKRSTPQKNITIGRKQLAFKDDHEKPVRNVKDMELIIAAKLEENMNTRSKPKRVINRSTPQKNRTIGRKQLAFVEEHEKSVHNVKDMKQIMVTKLEENIKTGPKPKRVKLESTFQRSVPNESKLLQLKQEHEKPMPVINDVEQILATKLKEKTELINTILAGVDNNIVGNETSDVRDEETTNTERVNLQADKLISCLTDLSKILEQLGDVVKEC